MRGASVMASKAGARALQLVDKLLAEKPDKVGHDFSEATHCLTAFRDELIDAWRVSRTDRARACMRKVNSVLSVIVGGHYPRGDIPWEHIKAAREELAKLV